VRADWRKPPLASVRAACKGEAEVKATYRLLHNEKLDMEQLLGAHRRAVLVEEIDAPEGQRPIRWVLLSSLPAESFQEAMRIVRGYIRRWLIEDFHRTLKSGCRVEALGLRESGALLAAVALSMVVAWRILYLRDLSRACGEAPASWFFTEGEWRNCVATSKWARRSAQSDLHLIGKASSRSAGVVFTRSPPKSPTRFAFSPDARFQAHDIRRLPPNRLLQRPLTDEPQNVSTSQGYSPVLMRGLHCFQTLHLMPFIPILSLNAEEIWIILPVG